MISAAFTATLVVTLSLFVGQISSMCDVTMPVWDCIRTSNPKRNSPLITTPSAQNRLSTPCNPTDEQCHALSSNSPNKNNPKWTQAHDSDTSAYPSSFRSSRTVKDQNQFIEREQPETSQLLQFPRRRHAAKMLRKVLGTIQSGSILKRPQTFSKGQSQTAESQCYNCEWISRTAF